MEKIINQIEDLLIKKRYAEASLIINKEENQKINIKYKKIIITGKRKLIFLKINTIKNNN